MNYMNTPPNIQINSEIVAIYNCAQRRPKNIGRFLKMFINSIKLNAIENNSCGIRVQVGCRRNTGNIVYTSFHDCILKAEEQNTIRGPIHISLELLKRFSITTSAQIQYQISNALDFLYMAFTGFILLIFLCNTELYYDQNQFEY